MKKAPFLRENGKKGALKIGQYWEGLEKGAWFWDKIILIPWLFQGARLGLRGVFLLQFF